ncbi:MAG TPA: N-acetyl-gamma-glutamyl-phosphate reductase [Candidatus Dormibacteraeota bacterium]|nr:N-acetyl-gamma-glutamyl-phosphate reductase [Candidatus Dormibacteraeota bacterium]
MAASDRLRAAVVGSTGYIGIQCVELLAAHPGVELVSLLGQRSAGRRFSEVVPGSDIDLVVGNGLETHDVDVVFAALPHSVAAGHAQAWLDSGAVVVDMSADFRIADVAEYQRWYGVIHPAPQLCERAVYGLVEVERDRLRTADLIAAPGCYPTAALLAALPALQAGLVESRVIVDAKSGVSGAGRSPSLGVHFAEVNESVRAYGVDGHRHGGEMLSRMRLAAGTEVSLTFVPHLVPMTRGILATVYLQPRRDVTAAAISALYRELCDTEPFLRYHESPPPTKSVLGSNVAALNCTAQDGTVVVTAAIDNLVKGAAGQGIQAMNVRFGLPESSGLTTTSPWP